MTIYRFSDLGDQAGNEHVFGALLRGRVLYRGGLSLHPPGTVTHDRERPHLEPDQELFVILQGRGQVEVNGCLTPVQAGDLILIEPGEDHHLICEGDVPLANLWLHAGD